MKALKYTLIFCSLMVITAVLGACSGSLYKDGVYSAQAAEFPKSGWKETVEVTIQNGKISKIDWDAIYKDNSIPIRKKQYSKSGLYGMLAGGAGEEWCDQAAAAEKFVLENGIDALVVDGDGYTDTVTSCTIHVIEFDELLKECLEKAKK